ncbi:MAG: nucleotidyltransferase substrate binding protein [Heliobacteriaceae bacterium]|jgi:nucleotidyltransferase substrate binding protein (TIGR01987 family)|nr:nucleotidyltransferase substrate binding protein [Heliobacteriaceae bacterium]
MTKDIRWIQRFQNFSRAFTLLRSTFDDCKIEDLSQLEQEGVIQRFKYTWELAWKTIEDLLEYNGIPIELPIGARNVIKAAAPAFFEEIGIDGDIFIEMLEARNKVSHMYDFEKFRVILNDIQNKYLQQLDMLYGFLLEKRVEND